MASIRSQMVLNDGMSSVLRKITSALDTTLNAFEQVQRASGRAVDAAEIAQARSALVGANAEITEMAEGYRRAAEQEEKLNHGLRTGSAAAGDLLGKVKNIVATLGVAAGIKQLVGLSDQMTSTTARLSLMVDDGGSVTDLENKIMASAQRSRANYLDTASAIASMGANAGNAFSGNDELIAFMEQVNKQFVIGGATAQGQSAAMLQLTQAMAAGALRGEELNSILENAPGIARAIERYMGVAEGSIKKYAEEGKITAEVVKNALFAAAEDTHDEMGNLIEGTNSKFESMPMTWAQVWTNMQNKALTVLDPILAKLNEIANNEKFNTFINGAINGFSALATIAGGALDILVTVGSAVVENWSWLAPIIWGVVAALGIYHGALIAINTVEAISNGLKTVSAAASAFKAGKTLAEAAATTTATGAQVGLNAALLACPITWIILAVIALIALFYAVVAAINHFAGTSVSATGIVVGVLTTAVAVIWNLFLALLDLVLSVINYMVNPWIAFANFFGNLFNDPIGAIIHLFGDLADNVLGVIESIAKAIDKVFGSDLASSVQGWRAGLSDMVETAATQYGNGSYDKIMDELNLSSESLGLSRWAYGDAWDTGYDFGQGIESSVGGLFNADLGAAADDYTGYNLDQITANTGSTADSAAGMADALDVSAEELEYLRDIAEREAVNRFTTAEVKIDMTGMTNRIDGNADLDGVLTTLTDGFAEALVTAAEGVHE